MVSYVVINVYDDFCLSVECIEVISCIELVCFFFVCVLFVVLLLFSNVFGFVLVINIEVDNNYNYNDYYDIGIGI